jgi:hypothetical protein
MATDEELSLAVLSDSAKRPRAPRDLPAHLRLLAALLRDAPAAGSGPRLLWRDVRGVAQAIAIERRLVIGRDATCDLVLAGARVSRRNSAIWIEKATVQIEDVGSNNGTVVNGIHVDRVVLHDGDLIEIGGTCLVFID